MTNKDKIKKLIDEVLNNKKTECAEKYLSPNLVERSPNCSRGMQGYFDLYKPFIERDNGYVEIINVSGEGDNVAVYHKLRRDDGSTVCRVAEIYRFEGEKVADHWAALDFCS